MQGLVDDFEFLTASTFPNVDALWQLFKNTLEALIEKHVPSKILIGIHRRNKPWFTKH